VLTQDALLLIGHGSTVLPDAARPLIAHAEVIRESGRFSEVKVGMLLGEPDVSSVFATLTSMTGISRESPFPIGSCNSHPARA